MPRKKPVPIPRRKQPAVAAAVTRAAERANGDGLDHHRLVHISPGLRPLAVACASLAFHPRNPRRHSEYHVQEIAASLKLHGQVKNLIASSRTDPPVVVCGNGTLRAALLLGWEWIACERMDLTAAQENALLVIDNLTGAAPDWDAAELDGVLADMDLGNDPILLRMNAELAQRMSGMTTRADEGELGSDGSAEPSLVKPAGAVEKYQIVIDCEDEIQQRSLLTWLAGAGVTGRARGADGL